MEERDKRKVERRPQAQRPKRIHADTTPREDEHEVSLEGLRARMSGLQERHLQLRETLSKPEKAQGVKLAQEFDEARANSSAIDAEETRLENSEWNDTFLETVLEKARSSENECEKSDGGRVLYHIGRKTIFLLSSRRIGIEFTPTYEEQEQERYYCVLNTKPRTDNKVSVSKDNVPFYLNLRELEKTYLQLSPSSFLDHVDNHLQAFVCRRGQFQVLKQHIGDTVGEIYHSLPYNLIKFSLEDPNCKADVELSYDNLASEYPTRCTVSVWSLAHPSRKPTGRRGGKPPSIKVTKAEELLRMRLLPEAYDDLLKEIRAAAMQEV